MRTAHLSWLATLALVGTVFSAAAQKMPVSVHKGADACVKQYSEKSASLDACLAEYTSVVNKIANDFARAAVKAQCERTLHEMNNEFPPKRPTPEKIMSMQEFVYGWNHKAEYYDEYVDKKKKEWQEDLDHFRELETLYNRLLKECQSDNARAPNSSEMQSARDTRYFEPDDNSDNIKPDSRGDHFIRDKLVKCQGIAISADGDLSGRGQCTSLLGKDMACELYKKLVAECTVCSSSDVGLSATPTYPGPPSGFTKRCAPSSEFRVNRPIRPDRKAVAKSSPERSTPASVRDSADAKSFGTAKAKNNLDRFDLGPTFVSPDTSSGVSRTARSAGSSKTMQAKTTGTSDAKTPKTSAAPMAAGGGIQGTVKTTGTSDASKTQKSLTAPIVGGTKDTVKEQVGGTGGSVKDPIK